MTTTSQDRFFDSNGVPIRYIVRGDGPAVVRLYGLTGNIDHLVESSPSPSPFDGYQFIAMDCRGHGKSGKPHDRAAYGLEMVKDVVRLLDHLAIGRAPLIGFSMGAEIALKTAARHPARVRSAVLAGSGWSDEGIYEGWRVIADSFARGKGLRGFFDWTTPPGQTRTAKEIEGFEQWNQALLAQNDAQALTALCKNYAELEELRATEEEVRALRMPILGIAGEHDPERPMLERMQGVAPDFTLIVLEGLGHGGPAFLKTLDREATSFFQRIDVHPEPKTLA